MDIVSKFDGFIENEVIYKVKLINDLVLYDQMGPT